MNAVKSDDINISNGTTNLNRNSYKVSVNQIRIKTIKIITNRVDKR